MEQRSSSEPVVAQLFNKYSAFCATKSSTNMFIHWTLSRANITHYFFKIHFNIIFLLAPKLPVISSPIGSNILINSLHLLRARDQFNSFLIPCFFFHLDGLCSLARSRSDLLISCLLSPHLISVTPARIISCCCQSQNRTTFHTFFLEFYEKVMHTKTYPKNQWYINTELFCLFSHFTQHWIHLCFMCNGFPEIYFWGVNLSQWYIGHFHRVFTKLTTSEFNITLPYPQV
jgi:hypothetical protein